MEIRYERLLPYVRRPARYIGGEINSVVKDWKSAKLRIALVFPDVYDIGMSHLGIKILYHILNAREDILCERAFAPAGDMEGLLREKGLPLVTLENSKPLSEFDIVGVSLSHELCYTNVLNILELSGIPPRKSGRADSGPLIMAGGPCAFNPEPVSDFIDLFLIGDGEDAVLDIAERYLRCGISKDTFGRRKKILRELSGLDGVYIPEFYDAVYERGVFKALAPVEKCAPAVVKKRRIADLKSCFYPTRQIISYVPLIHDRVSVEIMRGCPHRCRFCQASAIYSPVRIRPRDDIIRLAREAQKKTGHDEISLLSLSTGDYPGITELLRMLAEEFKPKGVSVSLPSLRIEKGIKELPRIIREIKKTGFTFAPEVASEKLRRFINKNIDGGVLLESAKNAYELGWRRLKLYFMVGFAAEEKEDIGALIEMAKAVAGLRPGQGGKKASVTVSVSSFIPKPHTPFQWEAMDQAEILRGKIDSIRCGLKGGRVKVNAHDIETSLLEGVFSRGDRRLGAVIESAFSKGARFDNWSENFRADIWNESFEKTGVDFRKYLMPRDYADALPWDHIDCGISKKSLEKESRASRSSL